MKNNIKILAVATLALISSSCDYNKQFEGLDEMAKPTDVRNIEYTLTDADYSAISSLYENKVIAGDTYSSELAAVSKNLTLSENIPANKYIPAFLDDSYPTVDNTSAIKVTYNYQDNLPEYISTISEGTIYSLSNTDYEVAWGVGAGINYFTPSVSASSYIPAILANSISGAVEGSIVMASYYQADKEPSGTIVAVDENFDQFTETVYVAEVEGWQNVIVKGTYAWNGRTYSSNGFLQHSAYGHSDGECDTYMITPSISVKNEMKLSFDAAYRYFSTTGGRFSVLVSENYTAGSDEASNITAVEAATWVDITSEFNIIYPEGGKSENLANVGEYDLSGYAGKTINIAFRYLGDSNTGATSTVQIDNVLVKKEGDPNEAEVTTEAINDLYSFNGSTWSKYSDNSVYTTCKADFAAMGSNYDNFSYSMDPDNYLPTFLASKYPYAQEDDVVAIAYKYYSNYVTSVKADEYKYTNGLWVKNNAVVVMTDQFVKSNNEWNFDPSVILNLPPDKSNTTTAEYYQAATDWVWENIDVAQLGCSSKGSGYVSSYGNNDYYTGCSAYYNNVDMRPSKARSQYATGYPTSMSDDEVIALMEVHFIEVMEKVIESKHSDMAPIDGIEVTFRINAGVYTGTSISGVTHTLLYKAVGKGDFEYVEDSYQPISE